MSVVHNDDTVTHIGNPFPGESPLYAIAIDSGGRVWVAALLDPLLAAYDPAEERWVTVERITDHVELTTRYGSPTTWGIAADRDPGHLWIATDDIVEVEGGVWRIQLSQYEPTAVFVDPDGYKWFGTAGTDMRYGLLLLSPDNQRWWYSRHGSIPQAIPELARVHEITRDLQGDYWFATNDGAVRFTPAK